MESNRMIQFLSLTKSLVFKIVMICLALEDDATIGKAENLPFQTIQNLCRDTYIILERVT